MVVATRLATADIGLRIQSAAFRRQTTEASNQLGRVTASSRRLARQQRITNAAFRNFGRNVLSLRRAVGLLAGGGAIGALVVRAADAGAELSELSVRTGVAVEELQVLQRVFEGDGLAAAQFERVINNLTRRVGEAADGLATYKDLFDELGVAVTDSNGQQRQTIDVIRDLTRAFPAMENESRRLAIATELLGNRGVAALTTFLRGPEAFAANTDAMRALGVLTQQQAEDLKALQQGFIDTGNAVRTAFFQAVADSSEEMDRLNMELRTTLIEIIPGFLEGVSAVVRNLDLLGDIIIALIGLKFAIAITGWASNLRNLGLTALTAARFGGPLALLTTAVTLAANAFILGRQNAERFNEALRGTSLESRRTAQNLLRDLEEPARRAEIIRNFLNANVDGDGGDILTRGQVNPRNQQLRERQAREALAFLRQRAQETIDRVNRSLEQQQQQQTPGTPGTGTDTGDINNTNQQIEATERLTQATRKLTEAEQFRADAANTFSSRFTDGILEAIEGTKSLSEAFRETARSILRDLLRIQVQQQLTGLFGAAFGVPGFGFGGGPPRGVGGTILTPFNQGTALQSGGYVGNTRRVRVGEAGPEEVILPARSRVLPTRREDNNQAFVFNINSTDSSGVQAALAEALPIFTQAAVSAVERRGEQQAVF